MIDATQIDSDGWWLQRLSGELHFRRTGPLYQRDHFRNPYRPGLETLDAYLRGDPPLPKQSENWAPVMRSFLRVSRMNLAEIAVDSVAHKMNPLGFRTAADNDANGDTKAARIFKASKMNIVCADTFTWMLAYGDSYMMVGPNLADPTLPRITAEHPYTTITSDDPITGQPRVALKTFRDDELNMNWAYLFRPGYLRVASSRLGDGGWEWNNELSLVYPRDMKDVVPIRRFRNRRGMGEFEPHIDTLDRLNLTLFQRVVVAEYQAFRMRIFAGLPNSAEDENGVEKKIDYTNIFTSDPAAVTVIGETEKAVQFFESTPINLDPIRSAIQDDMKAFAVATQTPLHLITPDAAQGSAEGASLQREGGTWKVEDRRDRADPPLCEIMSLAFRFAKDNDRTDPTQITTVWGPSERFGLSERYAAAVQGVQAGEPYVSIAQNVLQYSPEDVEWQQSLKADETLNQPVTPEERLAAVQAAGLAQTPDNPQQALPGRSGGQAQPSGSAPSLAAK